MVVKVEAGKVNGWSYTLVGGILIDPSIWIVLGHCNDCLNLGCKICKLVIHLRGYCECVLLVAHCLALLTMDQAFVPSGFSSC